MSKQIVNRKRHLDHQDQDQSPGRQVQENHYLDKDYQNSKFGSEAVAEDIGVGEIIIPGSSDKYQNHEVPELENDYDAGTMPLEPVEVITGDHQGSSSSSSSSSSGSRTSGPSSSSSSRSSSGAPSSADDNTNPTRRKRKRQPDPEPQDQDQTQDKRQQFYENAFDNNTTDNSFPKIQIDSTKLPYYLNLINQINRDIANMDTQDEIKKKKRIAKVVQILDQTDTEFVKPRRQFVKKLLKNLETIAEPEILATTAPSSTPGAEDSQTIQPSFIDSVNYPGPGAKLPECTSCIPSQLFQRPKDYFDHVQAVHANELPFRCTAPACTKRFRTETLLRQHDRYHGERKWGCGVCGEKFLFKVILERHERIHSGEKPFICLVCSKRFSQINHLTSHQLTHNEEKNFKCISCGKGYKRRDVLVRHCRTKNHVC